MLTISHFIISFITMKLFLAQPHNHTPALSQKTQHIKDFIIKFLVYLISWPQPWFNHTMRGVKNNQYTLNIPYIIRQAPTYQKMYNLKCNDMGRYLIRKWWFWIWKPCWRRHVLISLFYYTNKITYLRPGIWYDFVALWTRHKKTRKGHNENG